MDLPRDRREELIMPAIRPEHCEVVGEPAEVQIAPDPVALEPRDRHSEELIMPATLPIMPAPAPSVAKLELSPVVEEEELQKLEVERADPVVLEPREETKSPAGPDRGDADGAKDQTSTSESGGGARGRPGRHLHRNYESKGATMAIRNCTIAVASWALSCIDN